MATNINSFNEDMRQVIVAQKNHLAYLAALQKSMVNNEMFTTFDFENTDGTYGNYQLPTYTNIMNQVESVKNSIETLNKGTGTVTLNDGTRRQVKLSSVATAPSRITSIANPSTFSVDSNWFFENLMFPGATVSVDLTGAVEDSADRCRIKRVILDSNDSNASAVWENNILPNDYTYQQLISLLSLNNVSFYEDEQDAEFPLVTNSFYGEFQITSDPEVIDGYVWYTLDTVNYATVTNEGINTGKNNILSTGDVLLYNNTLFTVTDIDTNSKQVRISQTSGVETPGINSIMYFYEDPFRSKTLNIRFGAHEYDIIYFKAIQEDFNLLANEWSVPMKFATDSLSYEADNSTPFSNFYAANVVDWGANMIAEAKEQLTKAYYGVTPNAPTLYSNDFRVVQINTQINAALDNADIKQTTADIESTKSEISTLKSTIAAQKTDLQSITDVTEYDSLQKQIKTNTVQLSSLQTQYSSLVAYLQNLIKDNGAVNTDPKYHVRGFFAIPELKYLDEAKTKVEDIIGFDIAYRYIKEDETGVALNTYSYTGNEGEGTLTGTFSDWNFMQSVLKERKFNNETGLYEWASENIADGSEININQIDIAISKGEKLEFKVRSISEAGYPENCLKSSWSNSAIIEFPSTLSTKNELASLIEDSNDEALDVAIENKINSLGLDTHIDDTVPNTNSVNGIYFKHLAGNIAYEKKNDTGNTVETQDVQTIIDYILSVIGGSDGSGSGVSITDLQKRLAAAESTIQELTQYVTELETRVKSLEKSSSSTTGGSGTDSGTTIAGLDTLTSRVDALDTSVKGWWNFMSDASSYQTAVVDISDGIRKTNLITGQCYNDDDVPVRTFRYFLDSSYNGKNS